VAGYTDMAVDVLIKPGYNAWKNAVVDIAIQPPFDYGKSADR
jgi:hypothetical protein